MTKGTVQTHFSIEDSSPLHSPSPSGCPGREGLGASRHSTRVSANLRAPCTVRANWDTGRSCCHCTSCLPTLTRQSTAWHTSQCLSWSCWEAFARAAWRLGTQNESNRRGVCCLQQSLGAVSQHITHRLTRDDTAKPLPFADIRRTQTERRNRIQYALWAQFFWILLNWLHRPKAGFLAFILP